MFLEHDVPLVGEMRSASLKVLGLLNSRPVHSHRLRPRRCRYAERLRLNLGTPERNIERGREGERERQRERERVQDIDREPDKGREQHG